MIENDAGRNCDSVHGLFVLFIPHLSWNTVMVEGWISFAKRLNPVCAMTTRWWLIFNKCVSRTLTYFSLFTSGKEKQYKREREKIKAFHLLVYPEELTKICTTFPNLCRQHQASSKKADEEHYIIVQTQFMLFSLKAQKGLLQNPPVGWEYVC